MPKHNSLLRTKTSSFFSSCFLYAAGTSASFLLAWAFWSFFSSPAPSANPSFSRGLASEAALSCPAGKAGHNRSYDPPDPTFYDDPELSYTIEKTIKNWDEKRREWLEKHPSFAAGAADRHLMVTGSPATPCKNPIGDHSLLRFFKN